MSAPGGGGQLLARASRRQTVASEAPKSRPETRRTRSKERRDFMGRRIVPALANPSRPNSERGEPPRRTGAKTQDHPIVLIGPFSINSWRLGGLLLSPDVYLGEAPAPPGLSPRLEMAFRNEVS